MDECCYWLIDALNDEEDIPPPPQTCPTCKRKIGYDIKAVEINRLNGDGSINAKGWLVVKKYVANPRYLGQGR